MLLAPPTTFGYHVIQDEVPTSPLGATLTAHASTNTMGDWVSLLSTIDYDLFWIVLILTNATTPNTSEQVLVDLGIGPDSSNVTPIAEFLIGGSAHALGTAGCGRHYSGPLFVPAGTQLWGRCQSNISANTIDACVWGWGGPDRPAGFPVVFKWEAEGETAASSVGTTVTPGNAAMGSMTQIVASSAFDYCGVLTSFAVTDNSITSNTYYMKAGIGAATEQELGMTCYGAVDSSERISHVAYPAFADIPAGSRLAVAMACNGTPDSGVSAIVYGLRAA